MIGEVITLVGALLILLTAVGMVRFDDVIARLHALAKGSTLGVVLVLAGAAISLHDPYDITSLVLAAVIQVLASPPASNLLCRAVYVSDHIERRLDAIDEGAGPDDGSARAFEDIP